MDLPPVDISAIPLLDTAVGLFGSLAAPSAVVPPQMFEAAITVILIIYD